MLNLCFNINQVCLDDLGNSGKLAVLSREYKQNSWMEYEHPSETLGSFIQTRVESVASSLTAQDSEMRKRCINTETNCFELVFLTKI